MKIEEFMGEYREATVVAQFNKLLTDYGEAEFECGEWSPDSERTWEEVYSDCVEKKVALIKFFREAK